MRIRWVARAALPLIVFTVFVHPVIADDRVPLRDGVYTETPQRCAEFRRGELDFAPYEVDKGGKQFQGPETACVVAMIKMVRPPHRYHVETTCREFGETFTQSFILDVPTRERFSLEGEDYQWCIPLASTMQKAPAAPPLRGMASKALIDYWADQNDACRGGSGDDPATDKACSRRANAADELKKRGLCYRSVKGGQDWVRCRR
ncbi:hypothetical protein [Chelatococcus sp. HY11]|uniref:hypothetical protein n=1 Tax=Chelatococcus sp. HY11 TaxID=2835634 RepID=UPI001BD0BE85|nr:hypothetical protein [Chelatococcus sp. HY11]MBS7743546.1 hypothetical protein [Chelatococcus sp. HY11]CAH1664154.1 conserved hypothetical protein [Hyphomicrobiales bacterium]CAH1688117.1 conserved hypothetical protein [Hyphomicrobiales bacterium]